MNSTLVITRTSAELNNPRASLCPHFCKNLAITGKKNTLTSHMSDRRKEHTAQGKVRSLSFKCAIVISDAEQRCEEAALNAHLDRHLLNWQPHAENQTCRGCIKCFEAVIVDVGSRHDNRALSAALDRQLLNSQPHPQNHTGGDSQDKLSTFKAR